MGFTTKASGLLHSHHSKPSTAEMALITQQDKDFIAHFAASQHTLPPEEIQLDPRNKELGRSSKGLCVRDFELVRTLGTGTFARVWLVRLADPKEEDRDKVFALKVLRKVEVIKLKQVDHVNHERSVLADIAGHPFITTLITSFSDHDSLYMLLDYCPGGEVFSYLRKAKRFDENTARFYAAEIVLILEFLHEREGVAYRDLKPENLLLDAEGHIKLVDFGFAKRLGNSKRRSFTTIFRRRTNSRPVLPSSDSEDSLSDYNKGETYTLCGTPEYLAPEVIQSKGHTTAVDWWALGILIYEFLTGYPPFWNANPIEIYKHPLPYRPRHLSRRTRHHPPILHRRPIPPPRQHICGAARVKSHPFFKGVVWDDVYYRKYKGPIIPQVRYPGDAQCFDMYPDEKRSRDMYTDELRGKWEDHFKDF
ncbi:cAMP-dependent protein kinase catalytic subunit [Lachnellula subtilissima]|uniref:cAMP-dependent protein kinase catalytic subunit n=1 Tax=Lachnellula subtilissima TaxID=602034 RepID=A0A8H8REK1_9HELO|nr:cAMP-dependent protein kinase catalytic subunit [Lachnellula subtilissima]